MIILPAIDIIQGRPVRLYQGDYAKKETVADSVLDTAQKFAEEGADCLHMVDLDGAKSGRKENAEIIIETVQKIGIPAEVGGGIRTMEDISYYLDQGVDRVILGTAAINDEALLKNALEHYGSHIAVGMDCRDGFAMGQGWLSRSSLYYLDFAKHLEQMGVRTVIFTDISKDGTLQGPNLAMLKELQKTVSMQIIASGGIRDLKNIQDLAALDLYGAITGKAMYAGTLDLKQAIEAGKEKTC
ncbi:MAG: 1-(5-phosphoribosyl)-5-[(5-phosphoribosylamino)methylideneamino]imidazole-4-carboxamide isomerase [Erysipelotrichaceae bacterium]|nr:1-(5-phosphoribosyl)-5-[(5-phosphoribosylamino)methylideneamino]imidazole-4-carboxamide isomerase [Erysipelotrichaceae bacterium]